MQAFHNDVSVKSRYVGRVLAHREADEIAHGYYWDKGKGCAVGCTIHSGKHADYESEIGVPIMLARLEDRLFEGMSNGRSKEFPLQFLQAPKVGADLSLVGWKFLHWLLTEELVGRNDPKIAAVIKRCADVLVPLTKGLPADKDEARAAAAAADAADAYAYAAYAANAAADAAAAYAADAAAAYAPDAAAAYAAYAAYAADAAAYAAAAAAYAADAADAARLSTCKKCGDICRKRLTIPAKIERQP